MRIAVQGQRVQGFAETSAQGEGIAVGGDDQGRSIIVVSDMQVVETDLVQVDRRRSCLRAIGLPNDVIAAAIGVQTGIEPGLCGVDLLHGIVAAEQVPEAEFQEEFLGVKQGVRSGVIRTHLHGEHIVQPHAGLGKARHQGQIHAAYGDRGGEFGVDRPDKLGLHLILVHMGQHHQRSEPQHEQGG